MVTSARSLAARQRAIVAACYVPRSLVELHGARACRTASTSPETSEAAVESRAGLHDESRQSARAGPEVRAHRGAGGAEGGGGRRGEALVMSLNGP